MHFLTNKQYTELTQESTKLHLDILKLNEYKKMYEHCVDAAFKYLEKKDSQEAVDLLKVMMAAVDDKIEKNKCEKH